MYILVALINYIIEKLIKIRISISRNSIHANITLTVPYIDITTAITTLLAGSLTCTPVFVIDSGCSRPMCHERAAFTNLQPDYTPVILADGKTIYTQGIGSIGNFNNIYYVPGLHFNLLSVSYLNELNLNVTFCSNGTVVVTDQYNNTQVLGSQSQGLFHTTPSFFNINLPSTSSSTSTYSLALTTPQFTNSSSGTID